MLKKLFKALQQVIRPRTEATSDQNIEFNGLHGEVSLKSKQYPYMVDDPRHGIVTDQELINEIETMAEMPITDIAVLLNGEGTQHYLSELSLLQIVGKLKDGYSPIPF